ncbi:hypothetical protein EVAR_23506_1 [Eumeta japonica]|uniref:Uncharacterized protein n=1 Tax=Eumeta variegata TaxID=151549 RepID=A0A4C1W1W6_EUMVA|nr:hypothetical protein EVAR_23506_1 [Eumeta japonica]
MQYLRIASPILSKSRNRIHHLRPRENNEQHTKGSTRGCNTPIVCGPCAEESVYGRRGARRGRPPQLVYDFREHIQPWRRDDTKTHRHWSFDPAAASCREAFPLQLCDE